MKISIILLFTFVLSSKSFACSFAPGYQFFKSTSTYLGDSIPVKPIVSVVSIQRGFDDGHGGSCSDAGIITLKFEDSNSIYKTAYRFSVVDSELFSGVFPEEAVTFAYPERNKREMYFVWFDLGETRPEKLSFKLEVTAVSASGHESTPVLVAISEPVTEGNRY